MQNKAAAKPRSLRWALLSTSRVFWPVSLSLMVTHVAAQYSKS